MPTMLGYAASSGKRCAARQDGPLLSELVKNGPKGSVCRETGPPSRAAITGETRHAHFVPLGDLSRCSEVRDKTLRYSITSSAVESSVGGTVRPSSLAVCTLITSSNLLDCMTGRSAGLAPLRMRPT
jgi:hypothetical protein